MYTSARGEARAAQQVALIWQVPRRGPAAASLAWRGLCSPQTVWSAWIGGASVLGQRWQVGDVRVEI